MTTDRPPPGRPADPQVNVKHNVSVNMDTVG
jgi:hypothetical protein